MYIVARDKNLKPVAFDIPYTNLMWVRRWFDFGEFQMQIALDVYDPEWAFITSPDARNVGMIQKRQFSSDNGGTILLSGFFAEKALDRAVFASKHEWVSGYGRLFDDCAKYIQSLYNESMWGFLKITPGDYRKDSAYTPYDWEGQLGQALYGALETGGFSQIVELSGDGCVWTPLEGTNYSTTQKKRHPIILSSAYGDLSNYTVTIDDSCYKNTAIVRYPDGYIKVYAKGESEPTGRESQMFFESRAETSDVAKADAQSELLNYKRVFDVDADLNNPELIGDLFDLGDIITLRIDEMGLDARTRIVEVSETYSVNGKSTTVGFGNKRISNIRRAMK